MSNDTNTTGMTPTEAVDLIMQDPEVQACLIRWHCNELGPQLSILDEVAAALDPSIKRDPLQTVPDWGNHLQILIGNRIGELVTLAMRAEAATYDAIRICLADDPDEP